MKIYVNICEEYCFRSMFEQNLIFPYFSICSMKIEKSRKKKINNPKINQRIRNNIVKKRLCYIITVKMKTVKDSSSENTHSYIPKWFSFSHVNIPSRVMEQLQATRTQIYTFTRLWMCMYCICIDESVWWYLFFLPWRKTCSIIRAAFSLKGTSCMI